VSGKEGGREEGVATTTHRTGCPTPVEARALLVFFSLSCFTVSLFSSSFVEEQPKWSSDTETTKHRYEVNSTEHQQKQEERQKKRECNTIGTPAVKNNESLLHPRERPQRVLGHTHTHTHRDSQNVGALTFHLATWTYRLADLLVYVCYGALTRRSTRLRVVRTPLQGC
jgi:hypothetical protein